MNEREARFDAIVKGWEMGRRARPLFGTRWDELWATPLSDVRRSLGIEPLNALGDPA
jgi:ubiquinone biosynthesis protein Coq4